MKFEQNIDFDSFITDVANANKKLIDAVCELENVIHKFKLTIDADRIKGGNNNDTASP